MKSRSIFDLLATQAQLANLDRGHLELLAGCGHLEVVGAGSKLAREGEPADTFFVVRNGLVAIEARAPGTVVQVDSAGPGELVGWSWLIPPHRWHFDVRAVETTRLVVVDGACIRAKCEQDHEFGYRLMTCFSQVMVERLASARLRLLDLYGSGT